MIRLSICVATYNRAKFIGETLDSIVSQLLPGVELVIVDGASPDDTPSIVSGYVAAHPHLRYFREQTNSGVDEDYDKAVTYAEGQYCWLLTDDDIVKPGAVAAVLKLLDGERELVVVNAEVRSADFEASLESRFLRFDDDKEYNPGSTEKFFSEVANYLSFIGGVVIRRDIWLARERAAYFGTQFVHVGVIFQSPGIARATVIAEPMIVIRYGNAMWTARGFEIWMFKWPQLIWSFGHYSDEAKQAICLPQPWRDTKRLLLSRAVGAYSRREYAKFFASGTARGGHMIPWIVAWTPAGLVNLFISLYCVLINRKARSSMYDVARSPSASWVSRLAARSLGV
jgi:abequosyltransferase